MEEVIQSQDFEAQKNLTQVVRFFKLAGSSVIPMYFKKNYAIRIYQALQNKNRKD